MDQDVWVVPGSVETLAVCLTIRTIRRGAGCQPDARGAARYSHRGAVRFGGQSPTIVPDRGWFITDPD